VPGFGRRYRWFLRQPNLAPALYRSFFGLAERLTDGQWQTEDPDQVLRLLVNAFLEDLREAFRGTGWTRRYRTTVPVVLLDGITAANGGFALLRTISAVRNDTGRYDPLLLVATSSEVPPLAPDAQPVTRTSRRAATGSVLERWRNRLPQERRRRDIVAWLIIGRISEAPDDETGPPFERQSRHPVRTRRAALAMATTVLLGASVAYGGFGLLHSQRTCGDGFTWLGVGPTASDVRRIGDVCVGVTDGSNALVLPDGAVFDQVRTTILAQNQEALRLHGLQPDRPLVTLVFLGSLTAPPGAPPDALTAEREQLAGTAVVQAVQLTKAALADEPLVRVLIANAGPGMQHGPLVAEQLGRMAAADPSIVATVGLSESRAATAATIEALAVVGLPTVSATLSADRMVEVSPLYFQIAPQNRREAEVAAAYVNNLLTTGQMPAGRPLTRSARIYVSDDPADVYSSNLADDLRTSFSERGFRVETEAFRPADAPPDRRSPDAVVAGRGACDFAGVVLYAARGLPDFQAFAAAAAERCRDNPPFIVGGDDVTRYVADRVSRTGTPPTIPFKYLSFAMSPLLGGEMPPTATDFYARLGTLFAPPGETAEQAAIRRARSLNGHAALNYDAASTAVLAVRHLARNDVPITGQTLWPALMSVTDAAGAQRRYLGATGTIDFGGSVDRRVPVDKPITVVDFDGEVPSAADTIVCAGRDDSRTQAWCPFDS
jgi:hypothetical protein